MSVFSSRRFQALAFAGAAGMLATAALAIDGEPVGPQFSDDFSAGKLSSAWVQSYKEPQFVAENGTMVGRQINPDHGATVRVFINKTANVSFAFDAKFTGKGGFNAVIGDPDSANYTHAGHLARFSVRPKGINLSDDVEGFMKIAHRDLPKAERDAAAAPHRTDFKTEGALNDGEWHNYRLEIRGETATLWVDGKKLGELTSDGFDHPGKTRFGFTVNGGDAIHFDNVEIAPL